MTKQEQLIEFITQDIIQYLIEDKNITWREAMQMFYVSATFEKLNNIETGLYIESSAYVYDIFCDELKCGKLVRDKLAS